MQKSFNKLTGDLMEFFKVIYTGRDKTNNKIFDTNDEEVAKKEGVLTPGKKYEPILMIIGDNQLIPGFEEALKGMKPGESKTVEISPDKAYGERKEELVKLVPLKTFKDNNITPYPGMVIDIEGMPARIQSVSGGRVRIDFNHPLAGKTLIFDIKVVEKLEKKEDIAKAITESFFPGEVKVEIKDKEAIVSLSKEATKLKDIQTRKLMVTKDLKKYVGVEKVKFNEEY